MRSDLGSILTIVISFIVFSISLVIFYYFITTSSNNLMKTADIIANRIYNIQSENIKFLNNQTTYPNITLQIENIGSSAINLQCFNLFVNGYPTKFNYTILQNYPSQYLLPNEIANITFNSNYINNSWNYIILVDCYGKKYQTLLYINP